MACLPRLMGRGRALEVLLGGADIAGDLIASVQYPQGQERIRQLMETGLQTNADTEARLGHCTGEFGKE